MTLLTTRYPGWSPCPILLALAALARQHAHFHHIDLRILIHPNPDCGNERHLRHHAFARVAQRINETI